MSQTIAVFVPGITGSTLLMPNPVLPAVPVQVWPAEVALDPDNAAKLLAQAGIFAGVPLQTVVNNAGQTVPLYKPLIDFFGSLGFRYTTQNDPLPSTTGNVLVGFGYDWRQSNSSTAAVLGSLLTSIASTYRGASIWLVAHSMGGLVCRALLESGISTGARWSVQGLITLGTPHLGAPLALSAVTGECNVSTLLSPAIIEQVVDIPQMPAAFQLLPPPQQTFVTDSSNIAHSIYTGAVQQLLTAAAPNGFGAPADSFSQATSFFSSLNYGSTQGTRPNYYIVYGSSLPTVTSFLYAPGNGALTQQLAQQYSPDPGGDTVVPQWSAMFTGGWVAESYAAGPLTHLALVGDPATLQQVAKWMGVAASSARTAA